MPPSWQYLYIAAGHWKEGCRTLTDPIEQVNFGYSTFQSGNRPKDADSHRDNWEVAYLSDWDMSFDEYWLQYHFRDMAMDAGLMMKPENTIADKWPIRAARNCGVEILVGFGRNGSERYVEWTKARSHPNSDPYPPSGASKKTPKKAPKKAPKKISNET